MRNEITLDVEEQVFQISAEPHGDEAVASSCADIGEFAKILEPEPWDEFGSVFDSRVAQFRNRGEIDTVFFLFAITLVISCG